MSHANVPVHPGRSSAGSRETVTLPPPLRPPHSTSGRILRWALLLAVAGAGAAVAAVPSLRARLETTWRSLSGSKSVVTDSLKRPESSGPRLDVDGSIVLPLEATQRLGMTFASVQAQTDPIPLEVNGTTAYNPSTLSRVRSRFDALVSKVHASLGQRVRKGDLLVELFSTQLAQAKGTYLMRFAQWEHDAAQLKRQKPLFEQRALSEKDYYDTVNDERKSRLEYKVAHDNLIVYGLGDDEIKGLPDEDGSRRGWMTLRSPIDGLVIDRDVVEGNLYDEKDVLMTIAPEGNLWVIGNVYESDQGRVSVGMDWTIRFPFLGRVIPTKVEQVAPRVDPDTKTVPIRTTIADPDARLKADMLVQGEVLIPPKPGQTTVPRVAVVVADSEAMVFVRDPASPLRVRRRAVDILKESHDRVIISRGLEPGEQVVDNGSLILAQIDEDLRNTSPALAPAESPPKRSAAEPARP